MFVFQTVTHVSCFQTCRSHQSTLSLLMGSSSACTAPDQEPVATQPYIWHAQELGSCKESKDVLLSVAGCYRFFGAKKLWNMTCPVQTNHILVPNDIFLTKTQESFGKFYEKAIQMSNMSKYDASPKNQVIQLPRPAFPAAWSSGRSSKSLHQHKRHSSEAMATGAFHRSATQVDFCCCTHSIPVPSSRQIIF